MPNAIAGSMLVSVLNPDGTLVGGGGGGAVTISGQPIQVVQSSLGPSQHSNTSATAPTAGTATASLVVASAGTYRVVVNMTLYGTGVPVAPNNYRVQVGAQTPIVLNAPAEKSVVYANELVVTAAAGNTIQVLTTANEVAAVIVSTSLNVYRVV